MWRRRRSSGKTTGSTSADMPAAPERGEALSVATKPEARSTEDIDRAPDLTSRLSTHPSRLIVVAALDGNLGQYPSKSRELAGAVRKHLGHGALIGITAHVNPKVALQDQGLPGLTARRLSTALIDEGHDPGRLWLPFENYEDDTPLAENILSAAGDVVQSLGEGAVHVAVAGHRAMYEQGIAKLGGKQHAMPDLPEGFSTMPSKERMAVITNLPTDGREMAQAEFLPVKPGDMYELERVDSGIMWNRIRPA